MGVEKKKQPQTSMLASPPDGGQPNPERGDALTSAGDLPVGLVAAVVIEFSVGVVQDGPALGMLHGVAVTLVVDLAAP